MKKILLIAAAMPLLLAACGSDDETTLSVTPESAEIAVGKTVTLSASDKNVTWSVLDADIATIEKDVVTGKHVGETTVQAVDKNGNVATCDITVVASNNNFIVPILTWNATIADVKAAMTSWNGVVLANESADALTYTTGSTYPMYAYGFKNGALLSSILAVSTEQDEDLDLEGWLDQRYWYSTEEDGVFYYYDAKTPAAANNIIVYTYDADLDCVTVTFTPVSNTKAQLPIEQARKAAYNSLRKALNK